MGKLHTATRGGYLASHAYDALGRPSATTETIDGTTFTSSTTYDAVSWPDIVTYPSGLAIKNVYDGEGALLRVENDADGYKFWERLDVDSRGNVTRFRLGNGVETTRSYGATTGYLLGIASLKGLDTIQDLDYSYDALGNLTGRTDTRLNQSETFLYDTLNRVTQVSTTVAATTTTVTVAYGATGNIASKSDVGAYSYGQVHTACSSGFAGPHAVTAVTGTKTASYCYDRNGNMVSGDGRTVSYTAFDKPETLTKAGNTVTVSYGPDRARYKRVDQTASGTTTTVYAAGKSYELITLSSAEVRKKHYIGDFAVVTETTPTVGGSPTTARSFLHRDHLGSVDTITDGIGAVAQRLSFDAWGKRREINWQAMSEPAILAFSTTLTTRGFTGHEMLDPVGLVHMNGRVYDPELGRFLSADPFVQDVTNLQSWNRYAYVLNNPLSYTDPTGFWADIIALPEIVVIPSGSFDYIDRWMSGWYGAGGFGAGWYGGPAFGGPHPGFYWGAPGAGQPGVNAACVNCLSDGTMPDLFQLRVNGLDSTVIGLQNPAAAIKTQAYANMDGLGALLDRAQTGLDVAGLVPAIGTAADILNAGISLARGNTEDVFWSLAAAVPGGGLAVGTAKIARRVPNGTHRNGVYEVISEQPITGVS